MSKQNLTLAHTNQRQTCKNKLSVNITFFSGLLDKHTERCILRNRNEINENEKKKHS